MNMPASLLPEPGDPVKGYITPENVAAAIREIATEVAADAIAALPANPTQDDIDDAIAAALTGYATEARVTEMLQPYATAADTGVAIQSQITAALQPGGAIDNAINAGGHAGVGGVSQAQVDQTVATAIAGAGHATAADLTALGTTVGTKADQTDLDDLTAEVALKADDADLTAGLAAQAAQIALKADQTAVDAALALKADQTHMTAFEAAVTSLNAEVVTLKSQMNTLTTQTVTQIQTDIAALKADQITVVADAAALAAITTAQPGDVVVTTDNGWVHVRTDAGTWQEHRGHP